MSNERNPLTWKNIETPTPAAAAYPLQLANQNINLGFNNLKDLISGSEKIDNENWDTTKNNNLQGFLTKLSSFKTPDELAAAQANGDLDFSKFGAQIDQAAARAAVDNRPAQVRDMLTKDQAFAKQQTEVGEEPLVNAAMAALNKGDDDAYNQIVTNFPNLSKIADLEKMRRAISGEDHDIENKDAELAIKQAADLRAGQLLPSEIARNNASAQSSLSSAATSAQQATNDAARLTMAAETHKTEQAAKEAEKARALAAAQVQAQRQNLADKGNPYAAGVYDSSKAEDVVSMIKEIKPAMDDKHIGAFMARLNGLGGRIPVSVTQMDANNQPVKGPDGKPVMITRDLPISMGALKESILAGDNAWMKTGSIEFNNRNEGFADDIIGKLTKGVQKTSLQKLDDGTEVVTNKHVSDYLEAAKVLRDALNNPGGGTTSAAGKKKAK